MIYITFRPPSAPYPVGARLTGGTAAFGAFPTAVLAGAVPMALLAGPLYGLLAPALMEFLFLCAMDNKFSRLLMDPSLSQFGTYFSRSSGKCLMMTLMMFPSPSMFEDAALVGVEVKGGGRFRTCAVAITLVITFLCS